VTVPATINKLFKVIEYGYLREPVLSSGTLSSALALPAGLIKPIENIAVCEFNGNYIPVFCTRDWQMIPAGFDATLEQHKDLNARACKMYTR
jgi:hypothetical protein